MRRTIDVAEVVRSEGGVRVVPRIVVAPARWFELPEFRGLAEVRRAFSKGGIPPAHERTAEAGARGAAYWTLYELGRVLDELERCTRAGREGACSVRARELGRGHVALELLVEPADERVAASPEPL